jgi:predicted membrane chloride channel (bestrophin family)
MGGEQKLIQCNFSIANENLLNIIIGLPFPLQSLPFLFLFNWSLLGVEAAAVECESPFDYKSNHLTLGNASVLVARNIGQALKEMVHQ